jgi:hypothetical protein
MTINEEFLINALRITRLKFQIREKQLEQIIEQLSDGNLSSEEVVTWLTNTGALSWLSPMAVEILTQKQDQVGKK